MSFCSKDEAHPYSPQAQSFARHEFDVEFRRPVDFRFTFQSFANHSATEAQKTITSNVEAADIIHDLGTTIGHEALLLHLGNG